MNKKHNLTLCMIVKDEAENIKGTLENIVENCKIDYWVISDTGSTDNTIQIIRETFEVLNIPGKLLINDWKDFSTNRNYVIEEAEKYSEYLLFFDADDRINGNFVLPELTYDAYQMRFGPNFVFHRIFIVKTNNKWRYKGILHEFIVCDKPSFTQVAITGNYYVVPGTHGCRSKDPIKYLSDALVFEKAILSKDTPKDLLGRYTYYCAQSYKDYGNMERAVEFYKKTLSSGAWVQEKYIACNKLGNYYKEKNEIDKAMKYFIESRKYDSTRVECTLELSRLIDDNRIKFKILTSIEANSIANPISEKYLFIDIPTHNVFYFNEVMIIGYKLGEWDIVCDYLVEQVKRLKNISSGYSDFVIQNIKTCFEKFHTPKLITLFSEVQKALLVTNIKSKTANDMYKAAHKKLESIFCYCDSIPYSIFCSRFGTGNMSIIFEVKDIDKFIKTFNSYINCFEDKEYIDDYNIICSEETRKELLDTNSLFNFMKYSKNIFELKTKNTNQIVLDCNYYFCHKEKYYNAFISKLSDPKVDYIQFSKSSKNNYFSKITGCFGPLPGSLGEMTSFDIMLPYNNKNENELSEIDFNTILN